MTAQNQFLIMSWLVLLVGIVLLFFFATKIRGRTAPQIVALFAVPLMLILGSLFSGKLTRLRGAGIEIDLQTAKLAATKAVEAEPALAEAIARESGGNAIRKATARIEAAESLKDLQKVVPYTVEHDQVVFETMSDGNRVSVMAEPTTSEWGKDFKISVQKE